MSRILPLSLPASGDHGGSEKDGLLDQVLVAQSELLQFCYVFLGEFGPVKGYLGREGLGELGQVFVELDLLGHQGAEPPARDLTVSTQNLDMDEIIQVQKVPFEEVIDLITKGQIEDAKTIAAIFLAMQAFGRL